VKQIGRRRSLDLFKEVIVTLRYPRCNHVQHELAELHDVSQSTISRRITRLVPVLGEVLREWVPAVDDLEPGEQLIIDWALAAVLVVGRPPGELLRQAQHDRAKHPGRLRCTLRGRPAWVSDPTPGRTQDAKAVRESRILDPSDRPEHLGDKGYIGLGMITPIRKLPQRGS
jgi:hypothetical protein